MSTSGSIDFNMTARELVTFALRKINVCAKNEDPDADDAETARIELNTMLKGWQKYANLWRMTEGSVTLLNATASYALTPFPHKVISARYRDTGGNDTPLEVLTRDEYYDMPNKTGAGRPNSYYVDYQRTAATLYTWQVQATVTTETIKYTFQRKFEDVDDLANDIDVKQEHFEVVGFNLAARLADDYGRAGGHIDRVIQRAGMLLNDVLDDDREDYIQIIPGRG